MSILNGTKPLDDFIPWPSQGPNRPAKIKGKRVSNKLARPQENWRPEYAGLIMAMTAAGMSAKAIATAMDIRWTVFEQWAKTKYPVQQALAKGAVGIKIVAIKGLLLRAAGFKIDSEKVFYDTKTGKVVRARTMEYYPPDREAALALLNRRDPGEPQPFAPPARVEHTGADGQPLPLGGSPTFNTLMLLGSSPDDQKKAAMLYQQLIRGAKIQDMTNQALEIVPGKTDIDATDRTGAFLGELTELSIKYGIAITGKPVLFVMEKEDYDFAYRIDAESNLSLGSD